MREYSFYGKNLESCLEQSSKELHISKDNLVYKIISNKSSLFKKTFNIIVYVESESDTNTYDIKVEENINKDENDSLKVGKLNSAPKPGTVKVENGEIVVVDPINKGRKPMIVKGQGVDLKIDGKDVGGKTYVTSQSEIEVQLDNSKAKRELNINVSEDKMECYISIAYLPERIYAIEDVKEDNFITLNAKVVKEEYPPLYTEQEIIGVLKDKGITYGYCTENINQCLSLKGAENLLVANGKPMIPSKDDEIEIYFKNDKIHEFQLDESGNMDFKSIGNISSVKKGDTLCRRISGIDGAVGKNVFGQAVSPKKRKIKDIIPKEGCELKDKDTIIASIDGKPEVKGTSFSVHNVHKVMGDVDVKTGNIHFIGDVIVYGDVKEGMNIEAGNSIYVNSNVFRGVLKAGSDIDIKGNVISSSIKAGSNYVELVKYMDNLEKLADDLGSITSIVEQIKNNKHSMQNIPDNLLIKNIVDSKYRGLKSRINETIKYMTNFKDNQNKVYRLITDKLSDVYFSNINGYKELSLIEQVIREKLERMKDLEGNMSNITLSYAQDSNIEGSGDIIIVGKGVYKSYITAMNNLYFVGNETMTTRGGILRAKNEISVKIVGSPTGVSTVLAVSKEGHIYCNLAYLNTKIIVGEKEIILNESCKDVHAYLNKDSELIVDKFKL